MSEHITQNPAVALAMKHGDVVADRNGRKDFCFDDYGVHALCNAAIQHYKDSQPNPASVEEINALFLHLIMKLAGDYWDAAYKEGTESRIHDTPLGDAQFILTAIHQAVTQQAEALAQALAKQALPKFIVSADVADGVLTVTVLQREQDGITSLVHHEEIALLAKQINAGDKPPQVGLD